MFAFVTKRQYWDVLDSGAADRLPATRQWHMKSIQDAVAFSYLHELSGASIAEVGGGASRLLPVLAKKNRCFNLEEFKGFGGGPTRAKWIRGVKNIPVRVGASQGSMTDAQFDAIFSISVVEHVPTPELAAFLVDCRRILKAGGLMVHLIDVYLEDGAGDNAAAWDRVRAYGEVLDAERFAPLEAPKIRSKDDVVFSTSFATNPDNVMAKWNRKDPRWTSKRERAQGCTLLMVARRPTAAAR